MPTFSSRKTSPFEFFRDIASAFRRALYADHVEFRLIFQGEFRLVFSMHRIGAAFPQTLTFCAAAGKPGNERAS
jgi:hypothetical protein